MTVNILDQDIVVTILDDDTVRVNLLNPNQQQQSALEFQDEGVTLGTVGTVTKINFIGASVIATRSGSTINVTISGGGGSGTPGGVTTQIQYNNAGAFGGFGSWDGTTFALGTLGYSDTGIVASFQSSTNSYNQVVLQNTSSGASASTNFNVSNNNGTATTNYGEFGINSSGFTGTGSFSQAGYVYLAAATTDLVIGTYGNMPIHFTVNSGATDAMLINASGNVSIGAQTDTAKLLVQKDSLGVTQSNANGLYVLNTTAAAAGAQQISPSITWEGKGWKTASTAGSQATAFTSYVLPVQGTNNPTAVWTLASSVNAAAYANRFTVDTDGTGVFGNSGGNRFMVDNSVAGTVSLKVFTAGVNTFSIIANTGSGENRISGVSGAQFVTIFTGGTLRATFNDTTFTLADGINLVCGTSTGTKLGGAANQKLAAWGATPDVQPTNAIAAATFVANTSGIANDTATWGGYTNGQVVAALKRIGALA